MRQRVIAIVMLFALACQTAGAHQNTTVVTRERLLLAVDRLLADRWYPPGVKPPPPITPDDVGMLNAALLSGHLDLQLIAIRSLGRFEDPTVIPTIASFLNHESPPARLEALAAIGMALSNADTATTAEAEQAFETRLRIEPDPAVRAAIQTVIGHLLYDPVTVLKVQNRLAADIAYPGGGAASAGTRPVTPTVAPSPPPQRAGAPPSSGAGPAARGSTGSGLMQTVTGGALEALADLIHRHPEAPLTPFAQRPLVVLATPNGTDPPNPIALEALIDAHAGTFAIASRALHYHCSGSMACGEAIRRLGVRMMDVTDAASVVELENALQDVSPLVRAEAMGQLARSSEPEFTCLPAVEAIETPGADTAKEDARIPTLLIEIGMLTPKCQERDRAVDALELLTRDLGDPLRNRRWQVPAKAMEKLAELNPGKADKVIEKIALTHEVWQVRAAAARTARTTSTVAFLNALADDSEPNVRSEAITALAQLHAGGTVAAALGALQSGDHQLVIVAARALRGTTKHLETRDALLAALKRLTVRAADTSRPARLELLKRLKDYSVPNDDGVSLLHDVDEEIGHYLKDFDPFVAQAAADLLTIVRQTQVFAQPTYRAPAQPDEADLIELTMLPLLEDVKPTGRSPGYKADAIIELADGTTESLLLARDDAPLAVARFLKLARSGYYNGLTLHHYEPYRVAGGGSPAANDDSGDARFWRDEITPWARNVAGTVGLATQGPDTVDGRFFIDLTRLPEFDLEFTILARVVATNHRPEVDLSPLLDGTTVARIVVPTMKR